MKILFQSFKEKAFICWPCLLYNLTLLKLELYLEAAERLWSDLSNVSSCISDKFGVEVFLSKTTYIGFLKNILNRLIIQRVIIGNEILKSQDTWQVLVVTQLLG